MPTDILHTQCICQSPEHTFTLMMDTDPEWQDTTYLFVHLNPLPFWKRVVYAFKYIFGYRSKYGCYDEVILSQVELDSIVSFVNRVRDAQNKIRSTGISKEEWFGESGGEVPLASAQASGVSESCTPKVQPDRFPDGGEDSSTVPGDNPG